MRMGSDFVFVLMIYIRNSTQEVTVIYAITVTLIFENFSFRCDCTAIKRFFVYFKEQLWYINHISYMNYCELRVVFNSKCGLLEFVWVGD